MGHTTTTTHKAACPHTETRVLTTSCFVGAVGPAADQNPAAHGGVCETVECTACGARRPGNRNGRHEELGTWGATRAERESTRRAAAEVVRRLVADRPGPRRATHPDGRELELWIDAEGHCCARGAWHTHDEAVRAWQAWPAGLAAAQALRSAVHEEWRAANLTGATVEGP